MSKIRLSARDRKIVELVGEGHAYKTIAARMGIATGSVSAYAHDIARRIPGNAFPIRKLIWLSYHPELIEEETVDA